MANFAPPAHLSAASKAWFSAVIDDYSLEPHHVHLLTLAAEARDRAEEARLALKTHGVTYVDRFGQPRARPEIAIERDSRLAFARLLRELHLDAEVPEDPRPPSIPARKN